VHSVVIKNKTCLFLFVLFISLVCFGLSSCNNKNVDSRMCGFYIEVIKNTDANTIDDENVKMYVDYQDDYNYHTTSGNTGYNLAFSASSHTTNKTEEDTLVSLASTLMVYTTTKLENINIYPIYQLSNSRFEVSTDVLKTIDFTSGTSFNYSTKYMYNNLNYRVQISLKIQVSK
jgi:hypothetical protein